MRTRILAFALAGALVGPARGAAQESRPELRVVDVVGRESRVGLVTDRGFAAVRAEDLPSLGWIVTQGGEDTFLEPAPGVSVRVREGTPFFTWNRTLLQLADAPYAEGGSLRIPLQLFVDFAPRMLPERYAFDGATMTFRVLPAAASDSAGTLRPERARAEAGAEAEPAPPRKPSPLPVPATPSEARGVPVVIIDAGHGGGDPGALGVGGIREKDVALAIAEDLARALGNRGDVEVHMIRRGDTFVPLWSRGEQATRIKGERPGVFVSIHANSFPADRTARGFETYFLSEARTEHERRVAAIENAPLHTEAGGPDLGNDPDLGFILRELKNLDQQHWSALLADMVQQEMADVHPGPNRGVKQGPLAVLTNAIMPAVLVEVGYLSNPVEAPLMVRESFQRRAADALARAVERFFQRYPPGAGGAREEG